jgi:hypothetical protein
MSDVVNSASLLKVDRFVGESEDNFRTRVARALQKQIILAAGDPYSNKMLDRDLYYETIGRNESLFS